MNIQMLSLLNIPTKQTTNTMLRYQDTLFNYAICSPHPKHPLKSGFIIPHHPECQYLHFVHKTIARLICLMQHTSNQLERIVNLFKICNLSICERSFVSINALVGHVKVPVALPRYVLQKYNFSIQGEDMMGLV